MSRLLYGLEKAQAITATFRSCSCRLALSHDSPTAFLGESDQAVLALNVQVAPACLPKCLERLA